MAVYRGEMTDISSAEFEWVLLRDWDEENHYQVWADLSSDEPEESDLAVKLVLGSRTTFYSQRGEEVFLRVLSSWLEGFAYSQNCRATDYFKWTIGSSLQRFREHDVVFLQNQYQLKGIALRLLPTKPTWWNGEEFRIGWG